LALSASTLLIAAVDIPFQLFDHAGKLRMTTQQVRDEMKESEGRPEVKSRIRQLQRQMAKARMMNAVPKADVVITNPTHYAVALRYDVDKSGAPLLVAKGADLVAFRIREIAQANGVPVVSSPRPPVVAVHHSPRKTMVQLEAEELRIRNEPNLTRAERMQKLRAIWDQQLVLMGKK
jgi:flagellar biosynthetic protein FlhB